MNKVKKIFISIIIIFSIFSIYSINHIESNAEEKEDFISKGKALVTNQKPAIDVTEVTRQLVPIGQLLVYVGIGVLVAVTGYLGIQYLISSPDKQGALKEKLIGVVVAGVVIFGAYRIWAWVVGIFENL